MNMKIISNSKGPTYLAMVVRTSARESTALFLSCSPRMLRTFSLSQGDRSSVYWAISFSLLTSSGKTYHKWASLHTHTKKKKKKKRAIQTIQIKISGSAHFRVCVRVLITVPLHWRWKLQGGQRGWSRTKTPLEAMNIHR